MCIAYADWFGLEFMIHINISIILRLEQQEANTSLCVRESEMTVPVEDLRSLVRVEDEAGVVASEHSHDAQTQASGVAAR